MGELKIVCQHLDGIIVDYFNIQDELFTKQKRLESDMREGLYFMAKARYSMGTKSVSAIQFPQEKMKACTKVILTPADPVLEHDDPYMTFTPHKVTNISDDVITTPDEDILHGGRDITTSANDATQIRRRNIATTHKELMDADEDKISDRIQDLTIGNDVDDTPDPEQLQHDPIKWFGVLVPQALRYSQIHFRDVVATSCDVASLKANLVNLQGTIRRLLRRKEDIISSIDDNGFVIYDESSFLSSSSSSASEKAGNGTGQILS